MKEALLKYIKEEKLLQPSDKTLIAVSGGADSVALCYLFKEINFPFAIAHCNFQLRGNESDEDEKFVSELGKKLGVKVIVKRFETEKILGEESGSIQMIARKLRYKWFEELRSKERYTTIATAHHKNDNLETLLLNLTRGTGIAGLHGIKAKTNYLIRPLLFATKENILDYLTQRNISFREDSSNRLDKYDRNIIRLKVIPQLKRLNPDLEDSIHSFFQKINSVEEIFKKEVERFKLEKVNQEGNELSIDIDTLKKEPGALIKLYEVLKDLNFSFSQIKTLFSVLDEQPGKRIESDSYIALKDRSAIIVKPKDLSDDEFFSIVRETDFLSTTHLSLHFKEFEAAEVKISDDKNTAYLDLGKLQFPLILRKWQKGDYFFPMGMRGRKKLSDFLIDLKLSLFEKDKIFVLTSANKVVWVVGKRIDDRFKITRETQRVLIVTNFIN